MKVLYRVRGGRQEKTELKLAVKQQEEERKRLEAEQLAMDKAERKRLEHEQQAKENEMNERKVKAAQAYEQLKGSGNLKTHYCGVRVPRGMRVSEITNRSIDEDKRDSGVDVGEAGAQEDTVLRKSSSPAGPYKMPETRPLGDSQSFFIDASSDEDPMRAMAQHRRQRKLSKRRASDRVVTCRPDGVNVPPLPVVVKAPKESGEFEWPDDCF
jgi:hypothetical protein